MRATRFILVAGAAAAVALTAGCGGRSSVRVKHTSRTPTTAPAPAPTTQPTRTRTVVVSESAPVAKPGAGHVPDHAPAHGLRRKYAYQYHPDLEVYHSSQQGLYFWFESDKWMFGASLPATYDTFSFDDTVKITLVSDKPYTHHQHVTKAYPGYAQAQANASQGRGKGKGKGKAKGKPAITGVDTDD
jgi:hypothetical protein